MEGQCGKRGMEEWSREGRKGMGMEGNCKWKRWSRESEVEDACWKPELEDGRNELEMEDEIGGCTKWKMEWKELEVKNGKKEAGSGNGRRIRKQSI
jgi:hypothetical protein